MYITHNKKEIKMHVCFIYLTNDIKCLLLKSLNAKVLKYRRWKKSTFDNSL